MTVITVCVKKKDKFVKMKIKRSYCHQNGKGKIKNKIKIDFSIKKI